jgi:hypothetical protein
MNFQCQHGPDECEGNKIHVSLKSNYIIIYSISIKILELFF